MNGPYSNIAKVLTALLILSLLFLKGCGSSSDNTVILITPAPVDEIEEQIAAFNEIYPDIRVETMYMGVGEITTRIRAERNNPQTDVASDIPISYIRNNPELFRTHISEHDDAFADHLKDSETHKWYGNYRGPQVLLVNTNLMPDGREKVTSWHDLANPEFEGEIIMANPGLSSSAFSQLHLMVSIGGWELVEGILKNAVITPSSRLAYQGVADGEYAIGMLTENVAVNLYNDGYPVVFIYLEEGTNDQMTGISIIENSPNTANAELLFEFLNSREAHQISASEPYFRRSARPDVSLHPDMVQTDNLEFAVSIDDIISISAEEHEAMLNRFDDLMADM